MASSSSLHLSQALLARAVYLHGSSSDRVSLSFPSFSGLKSHSPCKAATFSAGSRRRGASTSVVRATAVETLDQTTEVSLVEKSVNTIRFLSIDAVEKANSGHPGLPMGCAPMGHILYDEIMRYNPKNPTWFNRDRFILSAGHGCMLQYALLHLAGYDSVQEEDLKNFRQWESRTPGHPENFETLGVEVTTGPLGQGIANAVGLALAEKHLAARFNKPDNEIVDHYTYVILGDGCQMEGISNEASSLAGHWGLGKLIAFYDDNHISIDGDTEIAFTENVDQRFEALGWHVIWVKNGNTGYDEIRAAIKEAKAVKDKPTLIKVTTTIGYGSPNKANSYSVHGSALGSKEVDATRKNLGWPYEPFHVPEDVKKHWSRHVPEGSNPRTPNSTFFLFFIVTVTMSMATSPHTTLFQTRTTPFPLSSPRPTSFKPTSIKCATQLHTQPPPLTHSQDRVFNFAAGPATLPEKVLLRAQSELYNWGGSGMSVMEMSHRGKEFLSIIQKAESDLRALLQIPPEYSVLFLQGGATSQFAALPLNLCSPNDAVDYIVTGSWSDKAVKEAQKYCKPNVIWSGKSEKYTKIPSFDDLKQNPGSGYLHFCANETIHGVEFKEYPVAQSGVLVADMSSNFCSKPVDVSKFGVIYAGAQKNVGPSGVTIVIVRKDLIGNAQALTPLMFDYKIHDDNNSLYNTPPCYGIYMCGLVFEDLLEQGGLVEVEKKNKKKADILYNAIDGSKGFYRCPVEKSVRSLMNVPFTLEKSELEGEFIKEAAKEKMVQLKGHRSVGGVRASIYNAMPLAGVEKLVAFMKDFQVRHA